MQQFFDDFFQNLSSWSSHHANEDCAKNSLNDKFIKYWVYQRFGFDDIWVWLYGFRLKPIFANKPKATK